MKAEKKACFLIEEKTFVDFKLRLRHDGLSQASFIGVVIDLYLRNEEKFHPVLHEIKSKMSKIGGKRNKKTMKGYKLGQETLDNYSLSQKEKDEIFDILEKEIGEL